MSTSNEIHHVTNTWKEHSPLLGPGQTSVIEGSLQGLDLGEEVLVDLFVVGDVFVFGLHHHALRRTRAMLDRSSIHDDHQYV